MMTTIYNMEFPSKILASCYQMIVADFKYRKNPVKSLVNAITGLYPIMKFFF